MEMTAFLESLKKLEELGLNDQPLLFSLDSQYVIKAVSDNDQGPAWIKGWQRRGWKKADGSPVANRELWQEIAKEMAKFAQPEFEWVKGTPTVPATTLSTACSTSIWTRCKAETEKARAWRGLFA